MNAKLVSKWLIIVVIALAIVALIFYFGRRPKPTGPTVTIGNKTISLLVAQTPEQRNQGLSGHAPLDDTTGMLFVFESEQQPAFWMKEMLFPLDLIWIDQNRVVSITENAPVPTDPNNLPLFSAGQPIDHVIEVTAGFVQKNHILVGDKVEYKL